MEKELTLEQAAQNVYTLSKKLEWNKEKYVYLRSQLEELSLENAELSQSYEEAKHDLLSIALETKGGK